MTAADTIRGYRFLTVLLATVAAVVAVILALQTGDPVKATLGGGVILTLAGTFGLGFLWAAGGDDQ